MDQKRQKMEPVFTEIRTIANCCRILMDLEVMVQTIYGTAHDITQKRKKVDCIWSNGEKYYMTSVEIWPEKYVTSDSKFSLYTLTPGFQSIERNNHRYHKKVKDAWHYALYWLIMKKN